MERFLFTIVVEIVALIATAFSVFAIMLIGMIQRPGGGVHVFVEIMMFTPPITLIATTILACIKEPVQYKYYALMVFSGPSCFILAFFLEPLLEKFGVI